MIKDPEIVGTRFVLAVKDLHKSSAYYKEKLGFKTWGAGDGWHFLERDSLKLMLGECPNDRSAFETKNHSYFAYIEVKHIDHLFLELQEKQVEILVPVWDQPWGQREFAIRTIDGHRITFGEAIMHN